MSTKRERLGSRKLSERQVGPITLQFPKELTESASLILNVLLDVIPITESYLETPLEGKVLLKVSAKNQALKTDPHAGVIYYTTTGDETRSQILAGKLSYQLGKILWYRGSSDANYTGVSPRTPLWLQEAAILQLKYIWFDREEWLKVFKANLELCQTQKLLSLKELNKVASNPNAKNKQLAEAQGLLKGHSITQRFPKWHSRLSRMLSIDFDLRGEEGLEILTATSVEAWEEIFLADINAWSQVKNTNKSN